MTYALRLRTREPMDDVEPRVRAALSQRGFGVLTEIDMQATLRRKLAIQRGAMRILGACHPALAHEALEVEPDVSVFLPCNVVLYEQDGETVVSALKPTVMLGLDERNEDLGRLARDAEERITAAMREAVPAGPPARGVPLST